MKTMSAPGVAARSGSGSCPFNRITFFVDALVVDEGLDARIDSHERARDRGDAEGVVAEDHVALDRDVVATHVQDAGAAGDRADGSPLVGRDRIAAGCSR